MGGLGYVGEEGDVRCYFPDLYCADAYPGHLRLEVPIIFHPDTDFQSMDGAIITPELWLEMPLNPERSIPFHCAVG